MPTTSHIYIPLHYYSSLHTDATLLQISIQEKQNGTFIYQYTAMYVPHNQYATFPNYSSCINGGNMPIYIPHVRLIPLMT